MTKITINNEEYEILDFDIKIDINWNSRSVAEVKIEMDYTTVISIFKDNIKWSRHIGGESPYDQDLSNFCISGPVTDNRDGTCSIKMGALTSTEKIIQIHYGGVN